MDPVTILYLTASLCIEFPTSPSGFACVKEYHWFEDKKEQTKIPLAKLEHPEYTYRDIQVRRFELPNAAAVSKLMNEVRKNNLGPKPAKNIWVECKC